MGSIGRGPSQQRAPNYLSKGRIEFHHHRIRITPAVNGIEAVDGREVRRRSNRTDKNIACGIANDVTPQLITVILHKKAAAGIEAIIRISPDECTCHQLTSVLTDPGNKNVRAFIIKEYVAFKSAAVKRPVDRPARRRKIRRTCSTQNQ